MLSSFSQRGIDFTAVALGNRGMPKVIGVSPSMIEGYLTRLNNRNVGESLSAKLTRQAAEAKRRTPASGTPALDEARRKLEATRGANNSTREQKTRCFYLKRMAEFKLTANDWDRRLAYHEAAHAIIAMVVGCGVYRAEVNHADSCGNVMLESKDFDRIPADEAVAIPVGGALAVRNILGVQDSPSEGDEELIAQAVSRGGCRYRGEALAAEVIRDHADSIRMIAGALEVAGKLNAEELRFLFDGG